MKPGRKKYHDKFLAQSLYYANKYYGGDDLVFQTEQDLKRLTPHQLNKITNWVTNTDPNTKARISGNKYSGATYGKLKKIF